MKYKKKGSYHGAHWFYPCTSRSKIQNQSLKYRTGRHNPPQMLKDEIKIKQIQLTLNKRKPGCSSSPPANDLRREKTHLQRLETTRLLHKPAAKITLMTPKRH